MLTSGTVVLEQIVDGEKSGVWLRDYAPVDILEKVAQYEALFGAPPLVFLVQGVCVDNNNRSLSLTKHYYHGEYRQNGSWFILELGYEVRPDADTWQWVKMFTVKKKSYKGEKIVKETL